MHWKPIAGLIVAIAGLTMAPTNAEACFFKRCGHRQRTVCPPGYTYVMPQSVPTAQTTVSLTPDQIRDQQIRDLQQQVRGQLGFVINNQLFQLVPVQAQAPGP